EGDIDNHGGISIPPLPRHHDRLQRGPASRSQPGQHQWLLSPCPHEGRARGCRGISCVNSNGLQFIAREAECPFPLSPFTIRKKGTFFVSRQGLVRLIDRPRSEIGHDPLRHRLVFLGLYVRTVEEAIWTRSGVRAATRCNHLYVSPTGVEDK